MRLSAVLLLMGSLFGQQDPTIRVEVRQVLVPVVVTDKKGHHVGGLRASDFHIFEDGVEQKIASFSTSAAASVDDIDALSRDTAGAGGRAGQAGPRRTFVICFDTLHASPSSIARIRQALEGLFEKERPGDAQYVLIGIGRRLQVLVPATTNPLALLVKVRGKTWEGAVGGPDAAALAAQIAGIRRRMDDFCKRCGCGIDSGRRNCDAEIDTLKQNIDEEAAQWAAATHGMVEQFQSVVEELAKLPTGRTLILVSDAFPIDAKREFYEVAAEYLPDRPQFKPDESASAGLQPALKVAAARNITIDTIDARGSRATLAGGDGMDASNSAGAPGDYSILGTNRSATTRRPAPVVAAPEPQSSSLAAERSATMDELARATGGVSFREDGDLLKQLRGALADGREYYVIAYVPKNGALDGRFRAITVQTTRPNLTIRAKAGYWAAGAAQ